MEKKIEDYTEAAREVLRELGFDMDDDGTEALEIVVEE